MPSGIFVTGGSGFVGSRVLAGLLALGRPVVALDRSGSLAARHITVVRGDLLEPDTYRPSLRSCDVVIHLAAATGRATAEEHQRVNARGTAVLLDECRKAGIAKMLFVSSIATTFPENQGYHYADAKRRAEESVSRSGLRYRILRPTMIHGRDAPNLKSLETLARLPVIVLPGTGTVRVQPVDVDDVARSIVETVREDRFENEIVELGGPEVLTMEELLQRIRATHTGQRGRVIHVPLGLLRVPLRAAEAIGLVRLLPISAGQLSSFQFDGFTMDRRSRRLGALDAECRVFTRYLLRREPDEYVLDKYSAARQAVPALGPDGRFDESLLAFAAFGPSFARMADSYASLFYRTAALRKRLVLLLAILETRPPFHHTIDRTLEGSMPILISRMGLSATGALLNLVAGTLLFAPARIVMALVGKGPR